MSNEYPEDNLVEQAARDVLEELGWQVAYAWTKETFGEDGLLGRDNKSKVILKRFLLQALEQLNPNLPNVAYQHAIDQISQFESSGYCIDSSTRCEKQCTKTASMFY